jgi:DNA-binding CsgD family transcriptional regulator
MVLEMDKQPHKHFSFTAHSEVADICKPLADIFTGNLFIYQRSFVDEQAECIRSNAYLCNNAEALEFILSISQKKREKAKYDYNNHGRKYVLVGTTQPQFSAMLRDKFNFNNLLCRDEQIDKNEWEHFMIGTSSKDAGIMSGYLNNIELLDKFVVYFRDKAARLIDKACNDRLASSRPIEKCDFNGISTFQNAHKIELFSKLLNPKHYQLVNQHTEKVMVPRSEMGCLIMLSQGRSRKEIAQAFNVSERTVESHIKNAKTRLKCTSKSNLLDILEKWKKSNTWCL